MYQTAPPPSIESGSKSAPSPFVCACKPDGFGSVCIHLEGELDLANLPKFRQVLRTAQLDATIVSLDLQELSFIDCCTVNEILDADAAARRAGGRLILVRGSGQVDRVMDLTGVLERMEVVDFHRHERHAKSSMLIDSNNGGFLHGQIEDGQRPV